LATRRAALRVRMEMLAPGSPASHRRSIVAMRPS
jgi:hypothetical protein